MSDIIISLLTSFPEYVPTHIVSLNSKTNELHVSFVYNTYDLIDKDLDFDEEYYVKIMENLRKIVFQECKTLVDDGKISRACIMCSKLIMKNMMNLEHQLVVDGASSSIVSFVNNPCF